MRKLITTLLLLLSVSATLFAQNAIMPTPHSLKLGKGNLSISSKSKLIYNEDCAQSQTVATLLKKELDIYGASDNKVDLLLQLDKSLSVEKEGYVLNITDQKVEIKASDRAGLFYGAQSLIQLLRNGNGVVPICYVEDKPVYQWRGFMLDESRHFFGKEKVMEYLDIMAALKLNIFHWHLTDEPGWRIEIKRYPKLTSEGSIGNYTDPNAPSKFYTQEEIKEIVAYAAERSITVIPEFDMPGHATAAARAYPEISGGGEGRWEHFTFNPAKDETYEFISNVVDEIIELFPAPYLHIGADEVHFGNQGWFTDPEIQQFIKDNNLQNETGLEHYFARRVADIIYAKGRKVIGWDEVIDASISPEKAVIMWWRHDRKHQLVKALENGYDVIMTPRRPMYGDFYQYQTHKVGRYWDGYNPIEDIVAFPGSISNLFEGYEDQILGLQLSMWTERIDTENRLDYMTFPRLMAVAESGWTKEKNKNYSLFMLKLPLWLEWLKGRGIKYFDIFNPVLTPEPTTTERPADVLQNG